MFNKLSVAAGMILLGSIIVSAGKAEAVVYEFEDFVVGDFSASGNFTIDDAAIPSSSVDFNTDLLDYNITVSSLIDSGSVTLTPANQVFSDRSITGVTASSSDLDFTTSTGGSLGFFEGSGSQFQFLISPSTSFLNVDSSVYGLQTAQSVPLFTASVPFEFSPTMGLMFMGGVFGISRLRKQIQERKLN